MKSGLLKSLVSLSINTFTEKVSYVQEEFNDVNQIALGMMYLRQKMLK